MGIVNRCSRMLFLMLTIFVMIPTMAFAKPEPGVSCNPNEFSGLEPIFSVTTTSDATSLSFSISAAGTFKVMCGDSNDYGTLSGSGSTASCNTINRPNITTSIPYSCSWSTPGTHTVTFYEGSNVTAYNTGDTTAAISFYNESSGTQAKIASVSGSLGAVFPQLGSGDGQIPRFYRTFYNATNLTTIPAGLFSGLTGGASNMFNYTFYGCTGLQSIPAGLFSGITTGAHSMFSNTFRECTGLQSIPANLFSGITTRAQSMFYYTFNGCSNITGYIPPSTFAGLIAASGAPLSYPWMWSDTFTGTQLATSCDSFTGTTEFNTKYQTLWNGKVSCECSTGYYDNNGTCTACTNAPSNATYTGSATTNACPWACDEQYYSVDSTSCTAVGAGYFSAAGDNTRTACTNAPSNATYTGSATTNACPWECDSGYTENNGECELATKFTLTTTSTNTFSFTMSAKGTFTVDCGDGGTLSQNTSSYGTLSGTTITRTSTSATTYTCSWGTTKAHNISFNGSAATGAAYNTSTSTAAISFYTNTTNAAKVASVTGSLGALFPQNGTSNGYFPRFYQTFYYTSNLQSVPGTLFSGLNPGSNATNMFYYTFYNSGLRSIPAGLFSDITIPANYMFYATFYSSSSLGGYIPPTTFAGLINAGHPSASNLWYSTFDGTQLATVCPAGTTQYITGYEGSSTITRWAGKVSCSECAGSLAEHMVYTNGCNYACDAGYYNNGGTCVACSGTKPNNSHYLVGSTTASCDWECDDGYGTSNGSCTACGVNEIGVNNTCETAKFTLTTTSTTTSFQFSMTAKGTFYVDCGDGGTLTQDSSSYGTLSGITITRTSTSRTTYTCTWGSAGAHTIRFGGSAATGAAYNTSTSTAAISFYTNTTNAAKVASVTGSLGALFPQNGTSNGYFPRFYQTFYYTSNLQSVPGTLFSGLNPGSNATNMFYYTFYNSGLRSIPAGLFSDITIPANYMFYYTFYYSSSLGGYIPPTTFAGLINAGHPSASNLWYSTFDGTQLATECPTGTSQYITGYEGFTNGTTWNSRVSCISCPVGQYDDNGTCRACTSTKPTNSEFTGSFTAACPWACNSEYYSANGTSCTAVGVGYFSAAGDNTRTACTNTKPANSSYSGSAATNACPWACDSGYTADNGACVCSGTVYNDTCHQMCSAPGFSTLNIGEYSYPLFADKTNVASPVLHIKNHNNVTCYVYMEADTSNETGLKIRYNNTTYHAIDPTSSGGGGSATPTCTDGASCSTDSDCGDNAICIEFNNTCRCNTHMCVEGTACQTDSDCGVIERYWGDQFARCQYNYCNCSWGGGTN